ncbi:MAG: LemA family protein [Candidatus Omnitrophota bacterium]|nr:LemA family protein [Candidatus Omnitrophota bacterium]MDZ4241187.1 LemA family protein [Candidatus Omnitrophota bacterium]
MIGLLVVIVVIAVVAISIYNQLVQKRFMVKEAWSGIDVQLKRRHDLVPNLVETVRGYMGHERKVLEEVTNLRTRVMGAVNIKEKGELENNLGQALKSLFAVAEAYPNLKANENFIQLQKQLAEIEDQLQLARRYYNGATRDFNILIDSFPSNIVAGLFNFRQEEFFQLESAEERKNPEVKF